MSRLAYRLTAVVVALATALVVVAIVSVIAFAYWALSGEETGTSARRERADSSSSEPRSQAATDPAPRADADATSPLTWPSRFARRLEAGDRFERILEQLRSGDADPEAARREYRALEDAILGADGPMERNWSVYDRLRYLTAPPRSLDSLHRSPAGRLDLDAPLRIWTTKGRPYPADERKEAEALLRHLQSVARGRVEGGVDVLATPEMGRDVFPALGGPVWAAGVYFHRDRFCAIRTTYRPRFRRELIKHELVHAFCRGYTRRFITSRFVSEGLAEYLRLCRTDVDEIEVDPKDLRNEMAALALSLDRLAGKGELEIDPERLVRLSPRGFYALRPWSYRLAQAMMAYVGGEVITRALRERTDRPIVAAVERVRWSRFVAFVRRLERGGDAGKAITIEDRDSKGALAVADRRPALEAGLRELALWDREIGFDWLGRTDADRIGEPRRRHEVSEIITERTDLPLVLLAGTSREMDRAVTVWLPGRSVNAILGDRGFGTSPHAFLESVHQGLEAWAGRHPVAVESFGRDAVPVNGYLPAKQYEANEAGMSRWARRWRDVRPRVVICLAASLEDASIEDTDAAERAYLKALHASGIRPAGVFVFDLSADAGLAEPIARAFARLDGDRACPVAYWAPRRH